MRKSPFFKQYELPDPSYEGADPNADLASSLGSERGSQVVEQGFMQSGNFAPGSAGWRLTPRGIEGASIDVEGGNIGGFAIGADYIRDAADSMGMASTVTVGDDVRFWAGATFANRATAPFRVLESGAMTASNLSHTGGSITGVPIATIPNDTNTDLSLLNFTHNLVFSVTDKDTVAWATGTITMHNGRTFSISSGNSGNMAARTYIYLDTAVSSTALQTTTTVATAMGANKILIAVAQNGAAQPTYQVYGGIGGIRIDSSALSVSNNNWSFSGTWSVTDADTIAWGAGTLKTSDGTSYSITGSNTGNMAAKTYVYFDLGVSSTAFQTTTTMTTAIGEGKILVAICQNATGEAKFIVVNDNQYNIDAANIVAGSITANELAAGSVTATKISVTNLSAISADLGTITAGTVTGATIRTAASGDRFSMTSTSFQGINSAGTVIFEIILSGGNAGDVIMGDDASGTYAFWDNSAGSFNVFADNVPTLSQGFFGGDGSNGALSITSGTTTLSVSSAASYVRNYTSISITGTGSLAFSNPHSGGTVVTLKSQGNVTITSSSTAGIDLRGMGSQSVFEADATAPNGMLDDTTEVQGQYNGTTGTVAGGARYPFYKFFTTSDTVGSLGYQVRVSPGAGGGSPEGSNEAPAGLGGAGGGGLIIECAGALNFTGTINSSGSNGANGQAAQAGFCSFGGGGGGSAGMVVILYNTLTSSSGTINASGGNGGNGGVGNGTGGTPHGGGSGGGSVKAAGGDGGAAAAGAGSNGSSGSGAGGGGGFDGSGAGGTGGTGGSSMGGLVVQNIWFS